MKHLNPEQFKAVEHKEGPLLIIAGAGAGKTNTVTHRILNLIKKGVDPKKILAITFTNKAAKEMQERVFKLINEDPSLNVPMTFEEKPFLSTFHSLGVNILRHDGHVIGVPANFSIYDRSDSKKAVKEALEKKGYDPKQYEPNKILGIISKEKGAYVSQEEYEIKQGDEYFGSIVAEVWKEYESILKKEKGLDFDDLIYKTAFLLKNIPEVRKKYQEKWQYIHIDEYQDTNRVQYVIANTLAEGHRNITVVGDADQNIYSWRGADIKNILDFEKDYPEATVILLEENYRSTQKILQAANSVIDKNVIRKKKNLFTKNEEGEQISVFAAPDENEEANFIARTTKELTDKGIKPEQVAVLYRANFQSRVIEDAFLRRELKYDLIGTKYFERKEVKDIISYLRAALNEDALGDIKRTINTPVRGIGKVTMLKVLEGKENELTGAVRDKVLQYRNILARIRDAAYKKTPSDVLKLALFESGIETMLKQGDSEELERLENVRELVTLAARYDAMPLGDGIMKFIDDAMLVSDQDSLDEKSVGTKLMTVHASKGLEFDYVFITGLEDGLFPHTRLDKNEITKEEAEEERRLFYVAITRARKKVFLTYAQLRTIFGTQQVNVPSEFIFDIEEDLIEHEQKPTGVKAIFIDF